MKDRAVWKENMLLIIGVISDPGINIGRDFVKGKERWDFKHGLGER